MNFDDYKKMSREEKCEQFLKDLDQWEVFEEEMAAKAKDVKYITLEPGTQLYLPKGLALWEVEEEYRDDQFETAYVVVEKPEHYK